MNQKAIAASLAALTLLGAGVAVAQPGLAGRGGEISRAELVQKLDTRFAALDADKDGNLSAADRTAAVADRFRQLDSDGNGALSLAEFGAARAKSGPGGEHGVRTQRHGRGEGMGRGGHHGRGGFGGGFGRGGFRADVNGDGAISKAEFQTPALAAFDKADANHDGKLSAAERQAARAARRAQPAA